MRNDIGGQEAVVALGLKSLPVGTGEDEPAGLVLLGCDAVRADER